MICLGVVALTFPGRALALPRSTLDRTDDATGKQIHVVYALPSDGTDRSLDTNGTLGGTIASIQNWLASRADGRRLRLDTFGGEADITFFELSETTEQIRARDPYIRDFLEAEIEAAGFTDPDKIYAVYYDGVSDWACGQGAWPPSIPGSVAALYLRGLPSYPWPCDSNTFDTTGFLPTYLEFAMLHEIMHTLGFAAACAPHHHLAGHVSDDQNDLMWAGGGFWAPDGWSALKLDTGNDDYFEHSIAACPDFEDSAFRTETPDPPVASGFLRVTTSPAVGSQIVVDGIPRDRWGLTWMKLAPGPHTVSFSSVPGFTTPPPQAVVVNAGETTTVTGTFGPRGWLRVLTNPAVPGTIFVDGFPRNDWGYWADVAAGAHTVCFGPVDGFAAPPCENPMVTVGETTTVTGDYVPGTPSAQSPFGYLRVTTDPPVNSQIRITGVPTDRWGLTWLKLPPASYGISFSDVPGFTAPGLQIVTVTQGETTTVTGTFVARGWLRVLTNPAVPATISVDGIPRNDWGFWADLPTGSHDVCFGPVSGFTAPPCQNVNLVAGDTTTVTGNYTS